MQFLTIVGTISLAWGSLWGAHFLFCFLWSTRGLRRCRCGSGHTSCRTIACCSITRICQFITANITSVMQGKNSLAIHLPGRKSQFECQKEFLNLVFVDMPWSSKRRQCIPMPMSLHIKNITLLQSGRGVLWLFQPTISNNAHTVLQPVHTRHCWRKPEFWD